MPYFNDFKLNHVFLLHTECILFFVHYTIPLFFHFNPAKYAGLLHTGPFFHSQISEEPRSARLLTLLHPSHSPRAAQEQASRLSRADPYV